ncbi:MAG: DNA polymerase III subunit delta' [Pseudomonadales bacterium]|nr:DNA polymerase III subunit delta' [Pseudomonadales bacterium]
MTSPMGDREIIPWLETAWRALLRQQKQDSLPHALLLTGPQGIGKKQFAEQLAAYLLCSTMSADQACGSCKSCHLLRAGSHPDLLQLSPEETGKAIKVDQVRAINQFVAQTAQLSGYKIIMLEPADALNINAANALLKNLEEPAGQCLFILITNQPSQLAATIRSRCHRLTLPGPTAEQAKSWLNQHLADSEPLDLLLNLANGAPLLALAYSKNDFLLHRENLFNGFMALQERKASPLEVAQQWQNLDLLLMLNWLNQCVSDLIILRVAQDGRFLSNPDYQNFLSIMAGQVCLDKLYLYRDRLIEVKRGLLSGNNPNKILLLEDLLIGWCRCISQ